MIFTICFTVPPKDLVEVLPKEEIIEYNKYRERLHSVNIKNRNKWNRIRSNMNNKHGRRLNYVDSKRT